MKHLAAYALLVLGGKENPTEKEVEKVVTEAGSKPDSEKVKALCAALKDKKFHELVATGTQALGSMGTGSGAPAAGGEAAAGKGGDEPAAKAEEPPEEEEDVDMGDLFGGDDDY